MIITVVHELWLVLLVVQITWSYRYVVSTDWKLVLWDAAAKVVSLFYHLIDTLEPRVYNEWEQIFVILPIAITGKDLR